MPTKSQGHTPGPWEAQFEIDGSFWIMSGKKIVATIEPRDKTRANATLIAAAPELLEACKDLREALFGLINQLPNNDNLADMQIELDKCEKAESISSKAIAKAEGR